MYMPTIINSTVWNWWSFVYTEVYEVFIIKFFDLRRRNLQKLISERAKNIPIAMANTIF